MILEPIMATAGCIVPPPGYLAKVREICDRYGVLLISDEVVCGFGRTGRWFGVDHFDVVPDIMVVAKGLTSGYAPMAAAIARREIAEKLPIFFDVHTYGGHPVSAAAALANIEIIEREDLVENAADGRGYMLGLLEGLRAHPIVGDVRGLGLFMAVELVRDPVRREDFAPDVRRRQPGRGGRPRDGPVRAAAWRDDPPRPAADLHEGPGGAHGRGPRRRPVAAWRRTSPSGPEAVRGAA